MKGTVLGVKFTHDGGVAMIRDGQLMFSVEIEKLHNNSRYSKITKAEQIIEVLAMFGVNPTEIDIVAVDGWKGGMIKTPFHKDNVEVAGYHEFDQPFGSLQIPKLLDWRIPGLRCPHVSYTHITGHIVGSYVSSVMSMVEQPAAVITFDGGQNARAHMVDPGSDDPIRFLGTVHRLHGILYGIMRYYFGPYRDPEVAALDYNFKEHGPRYGDGYEFPGKLMSYIALGKPDIRLLNLLHDFYRTIDWGEDYNELGMNQTGEVEHRLMKYAGLHARDLKDPDVLHTIHAFLEELIVTGAKKVIPRGTPLIFTGGSALNIKWNSALRNSGHFDDVWVPPFPNDAGSALGAAAAAMAFGFGCWDLDWNVYAGPPMIVNEPDGEWEQIGSTVEDLAHLLALQPSDPVVVLHGRAEIGPRALGHRSIIMSARSAANQKRLNAIKKREGFRPVAPICLQEDAKDYFDPGTPDPYMLFDHVVRFQREGQIPAVVHIDGTARLQTVGDKDCPFTYQLLSHYKRLTGISVLCNTSANLNGSGFFPDLHSATKWANEVGVEYVWCEGRLLKKVTR